MNILATVSILVKNRKNNSIKVNEILNEYGHLILARLGVNVQRRCIENCTAVISLVVEAPEEEIEKLIETLNALPEISAQKIILS